MFARRAYAEACTEAGRREVRRRLTRLERRLAVKLRLGSE